MIKWFKKMIKWYRELSEGWQIAIFAAVVAAVGGIIGLLMNTGNSSTPQKTIRQNGTGNIALVAEGNNITTTITTGIDPVLYGNAKEELGQAKEKIRRLEEKLAMPSLEASIASQQLTPVPSDEAKELAKLITQDDSPYARALKAIAEGNNKKADGLLDETQKIIDHIQQRKDEAQVKIYMARMQNASYAGRPRDALQWCDKLKPLAGDDPQILNEMGMVYYDNANYKEAETLLKRALAIDEAGFGKDHPIVAIGLNDLALLYKETNRLVEAEQIMRRVVNILENPGGNPLPNYSGALNNLAAVLEDTNRPQEAELLYCRALEIDEKFFGKDHPKVAIRLNNLAMLYKDKNRLSEVEPIICRALEIDEKSFGPDHLNVARDLANLASLFSATDRINEAKALLERAVKIFEDSLGSDHPKTIAVRQQLEFLKLCSGCP